MWIIPSSIKNSFPFALECVDSKEALNELLNHYPDIIVGKSRKHRPIKSSTLPLTWKSKHSSSGTWLSRWTRVYWIPRLFGRMLKPSLQQRFTEEYTGSLPVIHAPHSPRLAIEKGQKIHDTFGRLYQRVLKQLGLWDVSSKTSQDTSAWDLKKFTEAWLIWITELRQDCLLRQKLALHINEKDCSSSLWITPTTDNSLEHPEDFQARRNKKGYNNNTKVKNLASQQKWATPLASESNKERGQRFQQGGTPLSMQVQNWGTPRATMNGHVPGMFEKSNLEDQIHKNWSTPKVSRGDYQNTKSGKELTLQGQVKINWATPQSRDHKGKSSLTNQESLPNQVEKNWPTPLSTETRQGMQKRKKGARGKQKSLTTIVEEQNWPTPRSRDYKGKTQRGNHAEEFSPGRMSLADVTDGQQDQEKINTNGNRLVLNPVWVLELMGTTLERTFCEWQEMPSLNSKQKEHL